MNIPTASDYKKIREHSRRMANVIPGQQLCCLYYSGNIESGYMTRDECYAIMNLKIKFEGWQKSLCEVVQMGSVPTLMKV